MHDPMTVIFEIRYPWRAYRKPKDEFQRTYRDSFITIWHVDPEKHGDEDSCGLFMRARHGDKAMLEKIIKRFDFDWDRTWDSGSKIYDGGYFRPDGSPNMPIHAIGLNLFFMAAFDVFNHDRKKAMRFMHDNLAEILLFTANTCDSLYDGFIQKFGNDIKREERIQNVAACIYSWILRRQRPWWKNPRWHFHHWSIQCHPWQKLRRWLFSRCCKCGKRFTWGYCPISTCWDGDETTIAHHECVER